MAENNSLLLPIGPGFNITMQTTAQSLVQRLAAQTAETQYLAGTVTSLSVTGSTVIFQGAGRLVNASVIAGGTGTGAIYDFNSTTSPPAANQLYVAATGSTGVFVIGSNFLTGLVIVPGSGQTLNVTYSPSTAPTG